MQKSSAFLAAVLTLLAAWPARADIVVDFYWHEFGRNFPHAFLKAKGNWNKNGKGVDDTFGFTAKSLSPAILVGPVPGVFKPIEKHALAVSKIRFSVVANDAQYTSLLAVVAKWRKNPATSYDLDNRNCVHFVGEAAQSLGLEVTFQKSLMKSPRKFLTHVVQLNPQLSATPAGNVSNRKPPVRKSPVVGTTGKRPEKADALY
jgi:hypothetical protein